MIRRGVVILCVAWCLAGANSSGRAISGAACAQQTTDNAAASRAGAAPEYEELIARGRALREQRQFTEALECFSRAIEDDPRRAVGYSERGETYRQQAEEAIEQRHLFITPGTPLLFKAGTRDAGTTLTLQMDQLRTWDLRDRRAFPVEAYRALDDFRQATRLTPDDPRAHVGIGKIHDRFGEPKTAIAACNVAIRLDPHSAEAHRGRAMALQSINDYSGALKDLNAAIRLGPGSIRAYLARGINWMNQDEVTKALEDFNLALEIDSNYAEAYSLRFFLYGALGKRQLAARDAAAIIRLNPQSSQGYQLRACVSFFSGDPESALVDLDKAIQLDPQNHTAYHNRFIVLEHLDRLDDCLVDLGRAIELRPDHAMYYAARWGILCRMGRQAEGEADRIRMEWLENAYQLRAAIERRPDSVETWTAYAEHLATGDRFDDALRACDRAMKLGDSPAVVLLGRAAVWLRKAEYHKAAEDATAALRLVPSDSARSVLADAYMGLGDYDRAITEYERLFMADADLARAYLLRSKQHAAQGREAEAAEDRRRALQLDPAVESAGP